MPKILTEKQIKMLVNAGQRINIKVTPEQLPTGHMVVNICDGQFSDFVRAATEIQMLGMQLVSHHQGRIG